MTRSASVQQTCIRRFALLLVGCALLLRMAVPAGWMPQANAAGVTLSWCADSGASGPAALNAAKALLTEAVGKKAPAEHKSADQPCAFAMAAMPLAPVDPVMAPPALLRAEPIPHARLETAPGRGLAAPPPLATGPPRLG